MFIDSAKIHIKSGDGGAGAVSFRREKYVAAGGPDGGDGGSGGNVIFQVDDNVSTLADYRYRRKFAAQNGKPGGAKRCSGKKGEDLVLRVPRGTLVKDAETGRILADLSTDEPQVVLKGGRGGKGNMNYATATMQAPKYAQPGQEAKELWVDLELKVIADVGLVGFPNVGKSTLLSRVTNAKPKIANYHFTTLNPNLGVVDLAEGNGFVIADIPGIIEGASEGVGLGLEFLRHIERTKVMIHMVDAASVEGRDPIADIKAINQELASYNPELAKRPQVIAANKIDAMSEEDCQMIVEMLEEEFGPQGIKVFPISAVSGKGLKELLWHVNTLLKELPEEPVEFEQEYFFEMQQEEPAESIVVAMAEPGVFTVEGPKVERMLGYTNLESEKGFEFFQKFMKENGVLARLEELGIEEGDTVRLYNLEFDYYK